MAKPTQNKLVQTLSDIHNHSCNINTREIFLHGFYGFGDEDEHGIDYRQATIFEKNLSLLDDTNLDILIHMHTIGGEWNDGMAIYDYISNAKSYITILGSSIVCSMSSIIIQAADQRILMPNCEFMIHFGNISEENTSLAHISGAKMEEYRNNKMLRIYAEKCLKGIYFQSKKNYTVDKCVKFLGDKIKQNGDWWLTSDEALYYGFVDGIFGTPRFLTIEDIRAQAKKSCN